MRENEKWERLRALVQAAGDLELTDAFLEIESLCRPHVGEGLPVVVGRNAEALAKVYVSRGLIEGDHEAVERFFPGEVIKPDGRDLYGSVPLYQAAKAETVTVLPMKTPRNMREKRMGMGLSVEEMRRIAGEPEVYVARRIN